MRIKKIVAKNFIVPGVQTYEFDVKGGLIAGGFFSLNELPILEKLFNGLWTENTISFEKYYPKFAKKNSSMNIEIDAIIIMEDDEHEKFNKILRENGFVPKESKAWYYTIKCFYPYIFPIVNLRPVENPKEEVIAIGNHYEKFTKQNSSKRDILTVEGINAVAKFREAYFKYKNMKTRVDDLELHEEYLKLLKSTFRYDEFFIKKIGKIVFQIDDGDIINFGDQFDFFWQNKLINDWFNTIPLLVASPEIRLDFAKLIFDFYLKDLQWIYMIKTSNDLVEIREILYKNHCEKAIDYRLVQHLFKFTLNDEPIAIFDDSSEDYKVQVSTVEEEIEEAENFLVADTKYNQLIREFDNLKKRQESITEEIVPKFAKGKKSPVKKPEQSAKQKALLKKAEEKKAQEEIVNSKNIEAEKLRVSMEEAKAKRAEQKAAMKAEAIKSKQEAKEKAEKAKTKAAKDKIEVIEDQQENLNKWK